MLVLVLVLGHEAAPVSAGAAGCGAAGGGHSEGDKWAHLPYSALSANSVK